MVLRAADGVRHERGIMDQTVDQLDVMNEVRVIANPITQRRRVSIKVLDDCGLKVDLRYGVPYAASRDCISMVLQVGGVGRSTEVKSDQPV